MKFIRMVLFLMIFLFLCADFVHADSSESIHLVNKIDVLYRTDDGVMLRHYVQPANMETILNFLRLLRYDGMPAQDPELQKAETCRITVWLISGENHIYHLHANRYLSRDFHPWIKVENSQNLSMLLRILPSDTG